jgi:hypothetical protein
MKITPPWSRRRCAQPQTVTVWSINDSSIATHSWLRMNIGPDCLLSSAIV